MSKNNTIEKIVSNKYKHGFITDIEQELFKPGLNEEGIIRLSKKRVSLSF